MKTLCCVLCLCAALLLQPPSSHAVIYKYVDENGRMNFVDDEEMIPPQYRQGKSHVNDLPETLSTEEQAVQEEEKAEQFYDRTLQDEARHEARQQEKRRAYQTPVMVRGNRVLISIEVAIDDNLAHLVLLLDPEATTTTFYRDSLTGLTLPDSDEVEFSYIDVGPFHEKDVFIRVVEAKAPHLPYDGVLGMDFLKQHRYEINFDTEILRWAID